MAVKILVSRQISAGRMEKVMGLIQAMRQAAQKQPGFIIGETLVPLPRSREVLVISNWESIEDWNRWFDHPVRLQLQKEMDDYLGGRTEYTIFREP